MTLTDFLLARIGEDEAAAHTATPGPWAGYYDDSSIPFWCVDTVKTGDQVATHGLGWSRDYDERHGLEGADAYHIARHNPTRVLAECDAKRRIVLEHGNTEFSGLGFAHCNVCHNYEWHDAAAWPCGTLRFLALAYSGHPDYRQEWKP